MMAGHLYILVGPGGSGKTAIIGRIQARHPSVQFVPTTTTRPPRPGERDGREYYFVGAADFVELQARGDLLEWENIHGY